MNFKNTLNWALETVIKHAQDIVHMLTSFALTKYNNFKNDKGEN